MQAVLQGAMNARRQHRRVHVLRGTELDDCAWS
jgi:hypothetical protein